MVCCVKDVKGQYMRDCYWNKTMNANLWLELEIVAQIEGIGMPAQFQLRKGHKVEGPTEAKLK